MVKAANNAANNTKALAVSKQIIEQDKNLREQFEKDLATAISESLENQKN